MTIFDLRPRVAHLGLARKLVLGVSAIALTYPMAAMAQDDDQVATIASEETETEEVESIVVTGSRIKRDSNLVSSIPITALSNVELQASASFNASDIINELPAAGIPGYSTSTTNFSVFSAGISSVDLRNLGDSRTLTIVDGRRLVPGIPGGSAVDYSMIPNDFIETIEVITGGASSVYGSEAIAGVVNIILKDDFEGIELNARRGWREAGAGETTRISATTGVEFDGGNFLFNLSYSSNGGVAATDTDYTTDVYAFRALDLVVAPLYSTYPEQGRYIVPGRDGDLTLADDGSVIEWDRSLGFNRQINRRLVTPQERLSGAMKGSYEINEYANMSMTALVTHVSSDSDVEPYPLSWEDIYDPRGTIGEGGIPLTNPYIPADILAEAELAGATEIQFVRRMSEVSDREGRYDRTLFDVSLGFDGALPGFGDKSDGFGNWSYQTYVNFGRTASVRNGAGQVNVQNMRYALDAIEEDGEIICRDATARAFGCVPVNIFGKGAISDEAADYISAAGQRNAETEQLVLNASITGDLFSLPAGPVGAALGAEYREMRAEDRVDALTATGLNGGNAIESTIGAFQVSEYFAEILVPIVADVAFIDSVDFEGAFRHAEYSTAGPNDSWKYGVTASMFDEQLRLRAVAARAARAPTISDLYSGNAQSFSSTLDPCDGLDPNDDSAGTQDATVRAACLSLPGVAAAFAAGEIFGYSDLDTQSQYFFTTGSDSLLPETSDSYSVGFVFEPSFIDGLSGSIDYVNFEIQDAIASLNRNVSARLCLEAGNSPDSPFCDLIVRNDTTSKIMYAYQVPINAAIFKTSAIDAQVSYTNELPSTLFGLEPGTLGSFSTSLLWTYTDEYAYQGDDESTESDFMGGLYYPYNRANFRFNWSKGGLSFRYRLVYKSDQQIDEVKESGCDVTGATESFYIAYFNAPDSFCYTPGTQDWFEHDIYLSYNMDEIGLSFYGGVTNLTDEFVYIPSGYSGSYTGANTAPTAFDDLGRRFVVGLTKTF